MYVFILAWHDYSYVLHNIGMEPFIDMELFNDRGKFKWANFHTLLQLNGHHYLDYYIY